MLSMTFSFHLNYVCKYFLKHLVSPSINYCFKSGCSLSLKTVHMYLHLNLISNFTFISISGFVWVWKYCKILLFVNYIITVSSDPHLAFSSILPWASTLCVLQNTFLYSNLTRFDHIHYAPSRFNVMFYLRTYTNSLPCNNSL